MRQVYKNMGVKITTPKKFLTDMDYALNLQLIKDRNQKAEIEVELSRLVLIRASPAKL